MSDHSPRLNLPFIMPAQAQKHVTHNEALRQLDITVQLSVIARSGTPQEGPQEGDAYIITASQDELWSGRSGQIAVWQDGAWAYLIARAGWLCWNEDEAALLVYRSGAWEDANNNASQNIPLLGVNTTADETNKLSVKSENSLFDNDGNNHRLVVNKNAEGGTASLVLQQGYTGHAEIGLSGNNDLSFRVSTDGQNWITAFAISAETGAISFNTSLLRDGVDVLDRQNTPDILNLKGDIETARDLDDFDMTGMWHQPFNSRANSGVNYPGNQAGLLTVVASSSMVYQTYRFFSAAREGLANATFTRGRYNNNWSSWERLLTG